MGAAISANGGVFMGDAVMAFWGPPFTGPDEHARLACQAATAAMERLDHLRAETGMPDIDLRIGISSGEVIVGTIGSETSRNYTVMGDPVNLGSRLESANKAYGTKLPFLRPLGLGRHSVRRDGGRL